MIRLENVSKTYQQGVPAVDNVNLHIEQGEFVFIMGSSGSGKSTLIKMLLKELEPTSGEITINGQKLSKIPRKKVPNFRRDIGVVFQNFRLLPDRNVYENVAFALKVVEAPNKEIKKKVPMVLSMVGLAAKYKSLPRQLSGGEQQRVAIARAMVHKPSVVLADEPTGNLDAGSAETVAKMLSLAAYKYQQTIVMVTHDRQMAEYADRILTIVDGTVIGGKV